MSSLPNFVRLVSSTKVGDIIHVSSAWMEHKPSADSSEVTIECLATAPLLMERSITEVKPGIWVAAFLDHNDEDQIRIVMRLRDMTLNPGDSLQTLTSVVTGIKNTLSSKDKVVPTMSYNHVAFGSYDIYEAEATLLPIPCLSPQK